MGSKDQTTEALGQSTLVEHPPPGLARGQYPVPAWAVAVLGAAVLLTGIAYFTVRLIRKPK